METAEAVEQRNKIRETAVERFSRELGEFFFNLLRVVLLSGAVLVPIFFSFLTLDIPVRTLDHLFNIPALRAGNWLSVGDISMSLVPMVLLLIARRFGSDEAARAITCAWGFAAVAAFFELSLLAPDLTAGDFPGLRFTMAFIVSAMAGQYFTVGIYDITRGGGKWWRAPLYSLLIGAGVQVTIFYAVAYWGNAVPWTNWLVSDFALKAILSVIFLGLYWGLRQRLKPKGGYGG